MHKPIISIIVPTYNVAPYIRRCLDSVVEQTYQGHIECLIIDDCGQDDSVAIAQQFIDEYNGPVEFRIFHHEHNRGLSAARNTGIKESKGDYVYFLDSDDCISNDCIQSLCDAVQQSNGIQIAIARIKVIDVKREWNLLKMKSGIYDRNLPDYYFQNKYYIPACNKLIFKEFLENFQLYFDEGLIHEDYLWSFKVACHLTKMAVVDIVTYYYFRRENGSLDTIDDKWLHNRNYSCACALQAEYAMKIPAMRWKKSAFKYVERMRVRLFKEAIDAGRTDICLWHYNLIREIPYWNTVVLFLKRCTIGSVLRSLHKMLPKKLGFRYYLFVIMKFGF